MSAIPGKADVVVIGGGPAGSMASGLLAQKGFDVVLLEKATHPRNTVGESVLPHLWRFTDMLGDATQKIEAANFVKKAGGIVKWGGGFVRLRFKEFGYTRSPLHVDRDIFDKILLDCSREAGTKVFEQTAVNRVDLDHADRKIVHYQQGESRERGQIEAKYIVDASGQAAVIANQQGFRVFDDELKFSAIWGHFKSSDYMDTEGNYRPFEQRFDAPPVTFIEGIGGWGWSWNILLRKSVSVGIILPPERLGETKARGEGLDARLLSLVESTPYQARLLSGAEFIPGSARVIRNYAYKPVHLALDRCYLVGDACAFVDPINSAGVTFSMYAAVLAAWSIERSLKDDGKRSASQEVFENQYRRRLQIFRLIALPPDRKFNDAEAAELCSSFRLFSDSEKQLALSTTILTNRAEKVSHVFDLLGIEKKSILTEMAIPEQFHNVA